jgi:2-oxo-3-hexenedioate decarboxylase
VGPRTEVDSDAVRGLAEASSGLLCDGATAATGRGADVLGGPLDALQWLLAGLVGGVHAGEIVTTGTLTPALPVEPGQRWEYRLTATIALEPVVLEHPLTSHRVAAQFWRHSLR